MNDTRILVTGGTGFAGSHLIEALLECGFTAVYSTTTSIPDPSAQMLPADHYVQVDLKDSEATTRCMEHVKPEWVFHLASIASVGKSFETARALFANNINLQLNILEAMRTVVPSARLLTIGSGEEYGIVNTDEPIDEDYPLNPVNPYAVSKVTQDLLANSYYLSYGLDVVRARPFNHIGTRQTGDFAIPAFIKQIVAIERGEQETLQVGNLEGVRDFTSVEDMVQAYIVLMEKGEKGQVYNIGSGRGYKMKDIVQMLCSMATVPIKIEQDASRLRPLDVPSLIADNKRMRSLGWEPVGDIQEKLRKILEEWRNTTN